MAEAKDNILTHGLTGKLGDQIVFKKYGNRTIVSKIPDMSRVKKSVKQKAENNKFREAALYARTQMANPVAKAEYSAKIKGMQRAYNLAIADFYTPPEIKKVEVGDFISRKTITVHAIDDFKVVKVEIIIFDIKGELMEQGNAVELCEFVWEYRSCIVFKVEERYILTVRAWDKPGNQSVFETEIKLNL